MNYSIRYLRYLIFSVFFYCAISFGQMEIRGRVFSEKNTEPLPYVNIGIFEKGLGTVSDEEGNFVFILDEQIQLDNNVQFSSLGFEAQSLNLKELLDVADNGTVEIYLKPDITILNEVVVSMKKSSLRSKDVGHYFMSDHLIGYWKNDMSLGGEIGTKIQVGKRLRKIENLNFNVIENLSDSLLIRINFYDAKDVVPTKKIFKTNILYVLDSKKGIHTIDLKEYNLFVENDFIVSLELLKVYGNEVGLVVAGSEFSGYSYKRMASMGKWDVSKGSALQFYLKTTIGYDVSEDSETNRFDREHGIVQNTIKISYDDRYISGFIFSNGKPLSDVKVGWLLNGNRFDTDVETNRFGEYSVQVLRDGVLTFSHTSMREEIREIDSDNLFVNVIMQVIE